MASVMDLQRGRPPHESVIAVGKQILLKLRINAIKAEYAGTGINPIAAHGKIIRASKITVIGPVQWGGDRRCVVKKGPANVDGPRTLGLDAKCSRCRQVKETVHNDCG